MEELCLPPRTYEDLSEEERFTHERFMAEAYREAFNALANREVPIGAVVVRNGQIIGRGYNQIEKLKDATAHAEVLAITSATTQMESWRLLECTLYVTLEPCMMCLGASLQSRVDTIVFGASDSRFGAVDSAPAYRDGALSAYRRYPQVISGVMAEESRELIQRFFRQVRAEAKTKKLAAKGIVLPHEDDTLPRAENPVGVTLFQSEDE